MEYTIGVIIPIYNVGKYLIECLESVVHQTVLFDEVILVNDGSVDHSRQICEQYCKRYPYFQLINQKNQGSGVARNNGMARMKSDYFLFLDSDDYIDPKTVEVLKRKLYDQEVIFYSSKIKEDMEGVTHSNYYIRKKDLCNHIMSGLEYFSLSFPSNYIVSACMAIYKRSFIEKQNVLFPEGMYFEDDYFYIEVISKAKKVESISEQLYVRRYRPNSIMTSIVNKRKCLDKINIQLKIWDYIKVNEWIAWKEDILYAYLLKGVLDVMYFIDQYEKGSDISYDRNTFLKKFLENWGNRYKNVDMSLDSYRTLLVIYKQLMVNEKKFEKHYQEVERIFINKLKEKLNLLHLNEENIKVGIYGMGKHTQAMLKLYEQYVGKVRCHYFYILSEIPQKLVENKIGEHPIVSYKYIPEDTDFIIVSSLIHMNEMVDNLEKANIDTNKIYQIYNGNEVFDLVMVYEFINSKLTCCTR